MRGVHSFKVLVYSVQYDFLWIFCDLIRFATLEAFDTVMKSSICWIKLKWLNGLDYGCLPTTIVNIVITMQHMVSCDASKDILVVGAWFWKEFLPVFNLEILGLLKILNIFNYLHRKFTLHLILIL